MKYLALTLTVAAVFFSMPQTTNADLIAWQNQVTSNGTATTATNFSTVTGANPTTVNVGTLTGPRTFEFIVNSGTNGGAQALLGDIVNSQQTLDFEVFDDTGNYGITDFGTVDFVDSGVAHTADSDIHLVYSFDGTDTQIWVNGTSVATLNQGLAITGETGLGDTFVGGAFAGTALDGSILGFAAYDSALSAAEIGVHSTAFAAAAVPEPTSLGILSISGLAFLRRRRKVA